MSDCDCRLEHTHTHAGRCYNHGGRCDSCRAWRRGVYQDAAGYHRAERILAGRDVYVDAGPSRRRLQALAAIGYGAPHLQRISGMDRAWLFKIRNGHIPAVRISSEGRIRDLYERLEFTPATGRDATFTKNAAKRHGWIAPGYWDDIENGIVG